MLPHLGAGAGQGIEDAYVLARLLSHPETDVHNLEVCSKYPPVAADSLSCAHRFSIGSLRYLLRDPPTSRTDGLRHEP